MNNNTSQPSGGDNEKKMALFGHDENVRRVSSNPSITQSSKDDQDKGRCTVGKVKSCMKVFFAQLFSHVGLCGLVIGYSIMGAFIFGHLESKKEGVTRQSVSIMRNDTLNKLYDITGKNNSCSDTNFCHHAFC